MCNYKYTLLAIWCDMATTYLTLMCQFPPTSASGEGRRGYNDRLPRRQGNTQQLCASPGFSTTSGSLLLELQLLQWQWHCQSMKLHQPTSYSSYSITTDHWRNHLKQSMRKSQLATTQSSSVMTPPQPTLQCLQRTSSILTTKYALWMDLHKPAARMIWCSWKHLLTSTQGVC